MLFGYIQGGSLFPEPLSKEEEKIDARNILIERNLRLVAHVAKKYSTAKVDQDDLISIGTIGLIKGINSFKPEKNTRLSTYVARCVDNEILMFLRANKKLGAEVYLNEPIGKDKDDNVVTLQEVLENNERNIEDEVDIKMKIKLLYEKMKSLLFQFHLDNRIVEDLSYLESTLLSKCDYDFVNTELEKERSRSIDYLRINL